MTGEGCTHAKSSQVWQKWCTLMCTPCSTTAKIYPFKSNTCNAHSGTGFTELKQVVGRHQITSQPPVINDIYSKSLFRGQCKRKHALNQLKSVQWMSICNGKNTFSQPNVSDFCSWNIGPCWFHVILHTL